MIAYWENGLTPFSRNMLNCRMTPQLRGVPFLSEVMQLRRWIGCACGTRFAPDLPMVYGATCGQRCLDEGSAAHWGR